MTEGSIAKKIVFFALPIFLGNLFQQMYNVVDSLVVGNVLGKEALAAVSSSGSLIFLIVGFVNGIFVGGGVVIARYYGAKDYVSMRKSIHNALTFGLIAGVILMLVGIGLTPILLRLMGTPSDVLPNSIAYFRLYFIGGLGISMYNAINGVFQAVGDSKHPLYYLIIASLINVLLDIIFVAVLHLGIQGAALATVISQLISASLGWIKLSKDQTVYQIKINELGINKNVLLEILKMGIPTGVQNSVIGFANVIVQSNINSFGSIAMAGCGSYAKIEGFAFLPITSFSVAITTFVSQNLGAKLHERAKQGAKFGLAVGISCAEVIGIIFYLFAPNLIALFNNQPEVIAFGTSQAHTESLFYCVLALSHCMAGVLRGAGKTKVPMYIMLACWCVFRIIYITIATHILPNIEVIFWAYPITWILSSLLFVYYYRHANWIHTFD